jgi:hypothetical protein
MSDSKSAERVVDYSTNGDEKINEVTCGKLKIMGKSDGGFGGGTSYAQLTLPGGQIINWSDYVYTTPMLDEEHEVKASYHDVHGNAVWTLKSRESAHLRKQAKERAQADLAAELQALGYEGSAAGLEGLVKFLWGNAKQPFEASRIVEGFSTLWAK